MAARVISIEIGSSLTRVCETDYKSKTHKVYRYFTIPTPEGIMNDGVLMVTPEYTAALQTAILDNKMKAKQVVFSITSGRIVNREAVIPFVKESRLEEVVKANATDYFPVDLSKYQLTYNILGTVDGIQDSKQYKLLILAAPLALLNGYYEFAKALKLEVMAIDYAGNSVFQVVKDKVGLGTNLVLKIEECSTLVMAVRNAELSFIRNVAYGVEEVMGFSMEPGQCDEALRPLFSGITRVLDYYMSSNADQHIGQVYLTGLGAKVNGLPELLAKELSLSVEVLGHVPGWNLEKSFKTQLYGEYIACVGAAASPLGFRKEEKSGKRNQGSIAGCNGRPVACTVLIMGLVFSILLIAFSSWRYAGLRRRNMELQEENSYYESILPVYHAYQETLAAYNLAQSVYAATVNRNEEFIEFLEELERKMPANVHVVTLTSTADGVTINMNVSAKEEAAFVVEQMRTFESLLPESVTVSSVVEENDGEAKAGSVNFAVSAAYRDVNNIDDMSE